MKSFTGPRSPKKIINSAVINHNSRKEGKGGHSFGDISSVVLDIPSTEEDSQSEEEDYDNITNAEEMTTTAKVNKMSAHRKDK
ncbi:BlaI/MecI/CopY family transcriptional regulator [Sesbania bispinosa]|nr:BlaI/MecI/CopY family transcriptional regulator [Sesbania bispinosa]